MTRRAWAARAVCGMALVSPGRAASSTSTGRIAKCSSATYTTFQTSGCAGASYVRRQVQGKWRMKWTAREIARSLAGQVFNHKHLIVCPNTYWPGSETDLLLVRND